MFIDSSIAPNSQDVETAVYQVKNVETKCGLEVQWNNIQVHT